MTAATAKGSAERTAAYQDAALEIGKGIALGAVPFLGQAIDAYDTIESCITLYNAETPGAKEEAQFDLVMALVGWIPGPGDGVKKSLRLINKDPERFAPVLFDVLRFVLSECGIKTSPEALLAEVFDSSALAAEIDEVIAGVKDSSAYDALPRWMQSTITTVLAEARDSMPSLVGIVERRVMKWTKMQRNSSARSPSSNKPANGPMPGSKKTEVTTEARNGANTTGVNKVEKHRLSEEVIAKLTNGMLGVSGEHIADYICAYKFGWGNDWSGHDRGAGGEWLDGAPSAKKMGKISKGGDPKEQGVLYKLTDPPNGTGIDSIWKADPNNNNQKSFAIVEAKASIKEDGPKFLRRAGNTRQPSIVSTLGISGVGDAAELLEPIEDDSQGAGGNGVSTTKSSGRTSAPGKKPDVKPAKGRVVSPKGMLVQMSREWISKCVEEGFGKTMRRKILSSYSRHLFFSPLYHPSGSPAFHAEAVAEKLGEEAHLDHDAFHYDEGEVRSAVNKKKAALRKRYEAHKNLATEERV